MGNIIIVMCSCKVANSGMCIMPLSLSKQIFHILRDQDSVGFLLAPIIFFLIRSTCKSSSTLNLNVS